jgi:hypothetical protein
MRWPGLGQWKTLQERRRKTTMKRVFLCTVLGISLVATGLFAKSPGQKLMNEKLLLAPRILVKSSSKHAYQSLKINGIEVFKAAHGQIPVVKLNEILKKQNSVEIELDSISENWGGADYSPGEDHSFELRIYADWTANGHRAPYDLSSMGQKEEGVYQLLFSASWKPPKKTFEKYPVRLKESFSLPQLKDEAWVAPEYTAIANRIDTVGQSFAVQVNGQDLYHSKDYQFGSHVMPVAMTNWAVMPLLRQGENITLVSLPSGPAETNKTDAEFQFQIYPVYPDSDAALSFKNWTSTAHRNFFHLHLSNRDLKKIQFPYDIKQKFQVPIAIEERVKELSSATQAK